MNTVFTDSSTTRTDIYRPIGVNGLEEIQFCTDLSGVVAHSRLRSFPEGTFSGPRGKNLHLLLSTK